MFLVMDVIVERVIEAKGTEVVGARVELEQVDISFFPLGAQLSGLQVTDPDRPMRNALDVGTIDLHIEATPLLSRKLIINDLAVTNLRFLTPRNTSGALPGAKGSNGVLDEPEGPGGPAGALGFPGFRIPDVQTVLQQEGLRSVRLAERLRADAEERSKAWEERLAQLPNKKTLEAYRERISRVGKTEGTLTGVLGATGEFQALQNEINTSLKLLKEASSDFAFEKERLNALLRELRQAPQEDFRRLKDKYALSVEGIGNLTRLLLEDNIRGYVDSALRWYGRIHAYLAQSGTSAPGVQDSSKQSNTDALPGGEATGLPDFLIRTATISADLPWGRVNG